MTECNKSVYLANKSIDMIDAVNKGYADGYSKAIDDFVKAIVDRGLSVNDDKYCIIRYDNYLKVIEEIA